jgi:hypothetical protein
MKIRASLVLLVLAAAACGQTNAKPPSASPASSTITTPPAATPPRGGAPVWDFANSRVWDRNLLALMPQIDACLAKSPSTREISFAGQYRGAFLVRMQGENAVDCTVAGGVATIAPHNDALDVPGDGDALFVRGPGPNPGGDCYEAPEVRDANGAVLGWMLDTEGC